MTQDAQKDVAEPRRTRGRPVAMDPGERRDRILSALDDLFREVGLAGMTMSTIARRAGMSKQTVYDMFQDRDSLFDAYLERRFSALHCQDVTEDDGAGFEARLRRLFRFDEPSEAWDLPVALLRLAIAEAEHHPRLASRCLENGPRTKQARLQWELDLAVARGELKISDTAAAAALLMDMLHPPILEVLVSPQFRPSIKACEARFNYGLSIFLSGVS
ncbi:TetR/AcrR family transcriptional regulator [Oceanicola sp. S124]|uniref:TetR/AcrR family transcriptional regulator n=1 Tax=Oceanicola sp. S124 TaxID=1042378 RepID=UPI000255A1AC|nr:TetR/AcrR family transcriptional regulator [Oceanicola sp. S124]